ncbi:ribosome maturation factor RimM [Sporosarcina aquimarina]|uniref:Ribosome maturation factor RimM n=1 Tax=Sporosarcina aquimarina TaxID=114975 RepID=A0ABU4FYW6_9BACL|nr:ribosome maturation factor RimM [Sporosarcina aquimarina]MDW0109253.1 ribosome maturation factor RimM [Sporosarcina aquimarina]
MQWFNVGQLVNTHGVQGEVRVISRTDFPEERFAVGSELSLFMPNETKPIQLKIATQRRHKNFYLLTFENHFNLSHVEKYKTGMLKISEKELGELDENEFYYHEIIGCEVISLEGGSIGTVTDILETGANDVWTVTPDKGKPHYIPYIEDIVKEIDIENKKITIEVMDGLLS